MIINNMAIFKKINKVFTENILTTKLFICLLLLSLFMCFCIIEYTHSCYHRVLSTKTYLRIVRQRVMWFKETEGRNPTSINELRFYFKTQHDSNDLNELYIDFNKKARSDIKEYSILNNQGGYYYCGDTGEVRINLTKPVKDYMWFYFGKERNEIPANW